MPAYSPPEPVVLRRKDVLALVRVSKSTLWNWVQAGTFPPSRPLNPESKCPIAIWDAAEVHDWLKARLNGGTTSPRGEVSPAPAPAPGLQTSVDHRAEPAQEIPYHIRNLSERGGDGGTSAAAPEQRHFDEHRTNGTRAVGTRNIEMANRPRLLPRAERKRKRGARPVEQAE